MPVNLHEGQPVTLPHTAVELPFNYFDETILSARLHLPEDPAPGGRISPAAKSRWSSTRAMADAVVYLNGEEIIAHKDGYTPFEARLTGRISSTATTCITVKIDGSENPEIPPFGGRIDYLTYAGIYRDVWLKVASPVSIANVKIETPECAGRREIRHRPLSISPIRKASPSPARSTASLDAAADGRRWPRLVADTGGDSVTLIFDDLDRHRALGHRQSRALCTVDVELDDRPRRRTLLPPRFGFRTAEFTADGFLLNGKPLKLRGLNRHQSFPYAGYAMGRSRAGARRRDPEARRSKCNIVRTSHYPQSKWFLDHCDRIGLLVFEEIPGWQHIGGEAWKQESIEQRPPHDRARLEPSRRSSSGACASTNPRTTTISTPRPTGLRANSTRPARPAACATSPTANCSKTSTR